MYQIKNSILERDGKKVLALGQSYYPSFHKAKFPVPPEGDRIGEMKKDLRMMAEMGFNHVRFAAIGLTKLGDDGEVIIDTPLVDAMIEEADRCGLSVSVRLQGYAVNLRDFKDVTMIDGNGTAQDMTVWFDFIQTTMHHEGILEDNVTHAQALSRHYAKNPNVVGFQIYNEPHYPGREFFDYHPAAIAAYRRWLVEHDILTKKEAAKYQPPKNRREQGERMWALWRIFSRDSLTMFLDNASNASKAAVGLPTYTCFTSDQGERYNTWRGTDLFANARSMDIVGYTCYRHSMGAANSLLTLIGDIAQCAAELEGKQAWCIELDSRTYIPPHLFNRNTYATMGCGLKGLVYYQWRGDCPVPGVPHPNSCGLLNYDGTKTANFDNGARAVAFLKAMNDYLVNAHRSRDGIGLLHSDYAAFLCDARENNLERRSDPNGVNNSLMDAYTFLYRDLRRAGYTVAITDAAHLDDNAMDVRVLYVPVLELLDTDEREAVDRFCTKGGRVFTCVPGRPFAFREYPVIRGTYQENVYAFQHTIYDIAHLTGIHSQAYSLDPDVLIQMLEGEEYKLMVITNVSSVRESLTARIRLNIPVKEAVCRAMDGDKPVQIVGDEMIIGNITDGAIVILK